MFTGTNDFQTWVMYEMSGMTPEEFRLMWNIAHVLGRSETQTWFGHAYTGNGNHDPFSNFNNEHRGQEKVMALWFIVSNLRSSGAIDITDAQVVSFLLMIPLMSPKATSFADGLAVGHDRQVPGSQLEGPQWAQFRADMNCVVGFCKGMLNPNSGFWDKPLDSWVVGFGGSVLFGADAILRCGVLGQILVR